MLPPDHRAGPRSVRTPTAAARGGAQGPADTRCCRRAAPDSVIAAPASWRYSSAARIWAAVHTGHSRRSGNPGTPDPGNRGRCRFGRTVPVAQRQEPHRRLDRRQRVILTDVDVAVVNRNGRGVPQDDGEALRWYRLAADQGHAGAQSNLGLTYANGRGVPQDDDEAARWFRLAADQGHAGGQYTLGLMYGADRGVPQDYVVTP